MGEAISFPDKETVREICKREKIWPKVKKQLGEEGKIKAKQKTEEEDAARAVAIVREEGMTEDTVIEIQEMGG